MDIYYLLDEGAPDKVAEDGRYLNQELVDKGFAQVWK